MLYDRDQSTIRRIILLCDFLKSYNIDIVILSSFQRTT